MSQKAVDRANHETQPIFLGADPELFLQNGQLKFISSIGKFGGTKIKPKSIGDNCYIQEDNVAVEFNIPPTAVKENFVASINYCLQSIAERAKALNLQLAVVPSAHFDKDQLKSQKAKVFGCDPDMNAWTLRRNDSPNCNDASLRSAGGHVHVGCIGWMNTKPLLQQHDIARAMDLFLGVPSIKLDANVERRQLYGKSGAYRPKSYGVEYRTLSNFWLKSDELKRWVFDQTHRAIQFLDLGNLLSDTDGDDIQKCINNSNLSLMNALTEKYGLDATL